MKEAVNAPADAAAEGLRVLFFGHDCTESTVIKRARSLMAQGIALTGFMFRREKLNRGFAPPWPNVELGVTADRSYARRLLALARALPVLARHRGRLRRADAIYARNIDMCLLALASRLIAGRRIPIVYEVLDVHRLFTAPGAAGAVLRWCERRMLSRVDLLVVSSGGYVERYFRPVQRYLGPWFLLENKVRPGRNGLPAPDPDRQPAPGGRWRIGWFGSLRCEESLALLASIARKLPDRVEIVLRGGWPLAVGRNGMERLLAAHPNMRHGGEYRNPDDLAALYGGVDFYWGLDFHEKGANSDWLLPNRLYEGGLFGAVAIAARGTETGRRVEAEGLGWAFEAPYDVCVARFLETLRVEDYQACRRTVLAVPRDRFVETDDAARLCALIGRLAAPGSPEPLGRKGWFEKTG